MQQISVAFESSMLCTQIQTANFVGTHVLCMQTPDLCTQHGRIEHNWNPLYPTPLKP